MNNMMNDTFNAFKISWYVDKMMDDTLNKFKI